MSAKLYPARISHLEEDTGRGGEAERKEDRKAASKKNEIDVVVVVDDPVLFTGTKPDTSRGIRRARSGVERARRSQKELGTSEEGLRSYGGGCRSAWPSTSIFKTILTPCRDKGARSEKRTARGAPREGRRAKREEGGGGGCGIHSAISGGGVVHRRRNK